MNLTPRQKAFLLIALVCRGKRADSLFAFIPAGDKGKLAPLFAELTQRREREMQAVARVELRKLAGGRHSSYLVDVHDDWLVERLQQESPLMISTLLRYFPAERVRGILDRLPGEILSAFPRLSDTYAMPKALSDLLKVRFEEVFSLKELPPLGGRFEFAHIAHLTALQVAMLFLEVGYREIAFGLAGLPPETRRFVTERLGEADRQRVEFYVAGAGTVPATRVKRAQMHLVSREVDPHDPQSFVRALGFFIYSKALLHADVPGLSIIKRKMSKVHARELDTLVDENLHKNTEASVLAFREDVLTAVTAVLKRQGSAVKTA